MERRLTHLGEHGPFPSSAPWQPSLCAPLLPELLHPCPRHTPPAEARGLPGPKSQGCGPTCPTFPGPSSQQADLRAPRRCRWWTNGGPPPRSRGPLLTTHSGETPMPFGYDYSRNFRSLGYAVHKRLAQPFSHEALPTARDTGARSLRSHKGLPPTKDTRTKGPFSCILGKHSCAPVSGRSFQEFAYVLGEPGFLRCLCRAQGHGPVHPARQPLRVMDLHPLAAGIRSAPYLPSSAFNLLVASGLKGHCRSHSFYREIL